MWCFCQIPITGDYRYLEVRDIPQGVYPATVYQDLEDSEGEATEEYSDAWEAILMEYAKLNQDFKIENIFQKTLSINKLQSQYNAILADITYLYFDSKSDFAKDCIEDLKLRGYQVNTDNEYELIKSLNQVKAQAGVLITRIKFIELELKNLKKDEHNETHSGNFDDLLAWIHSELGVMPEDRITVRRYISYKEQIRKKISNVRHSQARHNR